MFDEALKTTLKHEGGYAFDKDDPGGETMYGITAAVARANGYAGPMREIPMHIVEHIYKTQYWDRIHADKLSPGIAAEMFDSAVNCGVLRAVRWLQMSLVSLGHGVAVDGVMGPKTVAAAKSVRQDDLLRFIRGHRIAHYFRIVDANPALGKFLKGWLRRVS